MLVSAICKVNDVPKQHMLWWSQDFSLRLAPLKRCEQDENSANSHRLGVVAGATPQQNAYRQQLRIQVACT